MKTSSRFALLGLAAVLLAGAVAVGVYLATEPSGEPAARGGAPVVVAGADPVALASAAAASPERPPVLPGPAATPPPEWRRAHPTIPVPVPNATPPIAGPPPRGLPADPGAREDAILELRRRRYADQIARLNQRNERRGGVPTDAGARPPPANAGPGGRRATVSGR